MKTLNVIYILRVVFGILAAMIAYFVVDLRFGDPLLNGITIALAVYLVSYYLIKSQFMKKIETPTKILTMGIGAYFLVFIMFWVLLITPSLSAPIASFTIDNETPMVGDTITFDATSSEEIDGKIMKYSWNFGDGGKSEEIKPTHVYSTSGNYSVSLTVVDDHGISSSTSKPLFVRTSN